MKVSVARASGRSARERPGRRGRQDRTTLTLIFTMNKSPNFPDTRWSLVQRAASGDDSVKKEALGDLYRLYFYPLYAYARQKGLEPFKAEDYTQDFLIFLTEGGWAALDPLRGRLRDFLRVAFSNLIASGLRAGRTIKRGGGAEHVPLDFHWAEERYGAEPADTRTPEEAFDRRFALVAYEAVLGELEALRKAAGKGEEFAALRSFLSPHLPKTETYPQVAARLGVSSDAVAALVHRLRAKFRDLMRHHIADTLANRGEPFNSTRRGGRFSRGVT